MNTSSLVPAVIWLASGFSVLLAVVMACGWIAWRHRPAGRFWLVGMFAWIVAVALKVGIAVLATPLLRDSALPVPPLLLQILVSGLLTGVFECGVLWLMVRRTDAQGATWTTGLAVGAGFGGLENCLLALQTLLIGIGGLALSMLPAEEARLVTSALADASRPWAFALERTAALAIHLAAALLIVESARSREPSRFWQAFVLKTITDAIPPHHLPLAVVEGAYATLGVCAVCILLRVRHRLSAPTARTLAESAS